MGSASMTPAAQPRVLAGNEVVSRSSVSPAEVPARSSQETVAIPAVASKTEQLSINAMIRRSVANRRS